MNKIKSQTTKLKAKRTFLKKGTCSRTFFYILNREFDNPKEVEEQAIDPLAGGILQQGYQCGMLWGASMAIGTESYRRFKDPGKAATIAIKASQLLTESFKTKAKSAECEEITGCDMSKKKGLAKFFFSGKFMTCFKLAGKWAPEAINVAKKALVEQSETSQEALSCASEVVKKMGGSEEEMAMVAGFAGGLGISGSGCGALSASIWKTLLELVKKADWKSSLSDPDSEKILNKFYETTDYEIECKKITESVLRLLTIIPNLLKTADALN